jgi:hypothetical protein
MPGLAILPWVCVGFIPLSSSVSENTFSFVVPEKKKSKSPDDSDDNGVGDNCP